jgi:hypothetical protein
MPIGRLRVKNFRGIQAKILNSIEVQREKLAVIS